MLCERTCGDGGSEQSDKDGHVTMSDEGSSATEEVYATISRRKRSRAKTCYDLAMNINYDKDETVDKNMCEELGLNGIEEGDSDEMHATTVVDNVEISICSTFSSETFKELGQALKDNLPDMKQECENI